MRRLISSILIVALAVSFIAGATPAYAVDASDVAAAASAAAAGVVDCYEASVVARMIGRAGAATATGAKGIAFEVMYSDKLNLQNLFSGIRTRLSESSIDSLADLVSTNAQGETVQLIQCKTGTSDQYVKTTIDRITNGAYQGVELVGDTEFAQNFNVTAEDLGLALKATDSGITEAEIIQVADKALQNHPSGAALFEKTLSNTKLAVALTGVISMAESIYRNDDVCETVANVTTDCSITATSVVVGTLSSAGIEALLGALGAGAAATSVAGGVVAVMVPMAVGYGLYIIVEKTQFEEGVETVARAVNLTVSEVSAKIDSYIHEVVLSNKTDTAESEVVPCSTGAGEGKVAKLWGGLTNKVQNAFASLSARFKGNTTAEC